MATYNKYFIFLEHLTNKVHDIFGSAAGASADTLKVALASDVPNQTTDDEITDIVQPTPTGNGYTVGGLATTNVAIRGAGTGQIQETASDITWTAGPASMSSFRYAVRYNDTSTTPADALINWWDYGSNLVLLPGETFTVDFQTYVSTFD